MKKSNGTVNIGLSQEEAEYLRKQYLDAFLDYRDNYINNISKGTHKLKKDEAELYKHRVPFLFRIYTLAFDMVHLMGIDDPETIIRCTAFKEFVELIDAKKLPADMLLTEKDREELKVFLDYMINLLKNKKSPA